MTTAIATLSARSVDTLDMSIEICNVNNMIKSGMVSGRIYRQSQEFPKDILESGSSVSVDALPCIQLSCRKKGPRPK